MKDLTAKLSRLSAELCDLEQELRRRTPFGGDPLCDPAVLDQLKAAVDNVRHLLWPYIQNSVKESEGIDEALQRYRMQRVTTMLNDLKERVAEPELSEMPEAKSFFASIQDIATTAVEKHLTRPPVAPKKRVTAEYSTRELKRLVN